MKILKMTPEARAECDAFLQSQKLETIKPLQYEHGHHYAYFDPDGRMVTYMCLLVGLLNNQPGSIAMSVEWIASVDTGHSATQAVECLKKTLAVRKVKCALFTQVARTKEATKFWNGRLPAPRAASILVAAFAMYDENYIIYSDVVDKGTVYN